MTRFLRTFLCVKQKVDHRGIRTSSLLIRSQAPYPLGHAAMSTANCICCLFSCQVLFLVITRFLRTFLCVKRKVDHRGIRTPNLLIRSQTPYPLGHAAMCTASCICCLFSCQVLLLVMTRFLRTFLCVKQKVDHRGIRTPNLLIRSQTPYPLGHAAMGTVSCICCLFSCQVSLVMTRFLRTFLCVKQKVDHGGIRTPNLLIRSQTPYPLGHAAMCTASFICCLFSCQVLFLVMTRFLRTFLCVKRKVDHRGIRTTNLLIRRQTPYPLAHAAMCTANCICCLFSCQVLSLVMTRFLRTFLCVKQKVDHRGIRTSSLLIRSQAPYPLGHAAMSTANCICCLFSCQVLFLVITRFLRTFLCVKRKVDHRGIRTPNLLIRSQTPYPLGHAAMCTASCICCLFSCQVLFLVMTRFLRIFLCVKQKVDHRGIRTPNLLIRSQTPYPLGHAAMGTVSCICCLFSCQVSLVMTRFLRTFLCVKQKVDHRGIRTPNLLIRSQTPYPLGHAAMCTASFICCLFSCQVLFLVMTRFLRTFLCVKRKVDHRGIRTTNLLIRRQTPYPLAHAAMCTANCICCLFSCQVLSLVMTRFLRTFLCVKQKVDHRGIRTSSLLIRSQAPYPLGHAAMSTANCICCLFSCQVLFLVITRFLRTFLCVKRKVDHRGIRTPNLLIRSQTPYPLGHAAMCTASCICCLFSCQVLFLVMTRFLRIFLCVKQKVDHRGIRTPNLLIRSQTPYPLGHAAMGTVSCICCLFSCQVSLVMTRFLRTFLCVKQKVDHRGIRTPNLLIRSQTPYPLGHAAMCTASFICCLFSCQVLFLVMTRFLRTFLCVKRKVDHRGIRTTNLLIRSQTPYPLAHAAMCTANCICCLFSCQVLSLVMTRFLRTFLCVKQKVDHRGIRTSSLLIRSQAPYPLGHAAMSTANCICCLFSCQVLFLVITRFLRTFLCVKRKVDHRGIRTPNLLIRSQTPYPLGHAAMCTASCICCLFSCQVLLLVMTRFLRTFLCVKQKVDHRGIRTPNLLIRSQTPYPLAHAAMCTANCICCFFSCQVLSLVMTRFLRTFLCVKQKVDHRGIRTPNLLIRSQAPYPLGHAAMCTANCICCLFSCQVLFLVMTRFLRIFLCVKQKVDHRGIRTPNLLIRSQTPYPLGHAAMGTVSCICCLFSCQVSLVMTRFLRTFLCVKQKVDHRGIRTPNLLIRSQTPYPLGHAAMCTANCVCYLFSCQVLFLVMTRFLRTFLCVKQKVDHRLIRTPNLLIPSQTLYPLGHAAIWTVNIVFVAYSVAKCSPL